MQLTQEHMELQRTVENFVQEKLNPFCDEWENAPPFPAKEVFKEMSKLGLLGINKPEAYGGMGLDYSYAMVAAEALGSVNAAGVALSIGVQTDMATPALARFGSDRLREEFLAPAISGDAIAAIAVSEPQAGSDVAQIKTQAKSDGDDYIISGQKMWITNATQADYFCVLANTSEGKPHFNKSLIIVPSKTKGVTIGHKLDKMGMRCSDTAPVYFDSVRVPKRHCIGAENQGFMLQMIQFQEERLWGAANAIRGMELSIEETIAYCQERQTFGLHLIDNQSIHFKIAELKTEVACLRGFLYNTCEDYINGKDVMQQAAMAKLKAGRVARLVTDQCLQLWGGNGYMQDSMINRRYRDARLISIGGGTDEMMLGIICKTMNILPRRQKTSSKKEVTEA